MALAREYPQEALQNAALPLFALEDPTLYRKILLAAYHGVLDNKMPALLESTCSLLATDFIGYLLPASTPENFLIAIREAIHTTRSFSVGKGSQKRMEEACTKAAALFLDLPKDHVLAFANFGDALLYLCYSPSTSLYCLMNTEGIEWLFKRVEEYEAGAPGPYPLSRAL